MDKIRFNLRRGMAPKEILGELHGRTSGETAQELQYFMERPESPQFEMPSHEVMVQDKDYAMILKRVVHTDKFGNDSVDVEYYLAGINDEGKYFVHTLGNVASKFDRPPTIGALLKWVNREDAGVEWKRIQGDVLMCLRSYEHDSRDMTLQTMNASIALNVPEFPGTRFGLSLRATSGLALKLGRHVLTTDGRIEYQDKVFEDAPVIAAMGNIFTLIHPEHAPLSVEIPHNQFALLTGQRGRSFSVETRTNIPQFRGFD